jgi:hypothetical protein
MSDTPPPLRVGDRERRAVDEQLQAAVGDGVLTLSEYDERSAVLWQARTRAELEDLVADLPDTHAPAPAPLPAPTGGRPRRVVAVMSEDRLSGALGAGQQVQGYAVMGKAVVDLRRDDLPRRVEVQVRSLMGEVEVMVPPGSAVHLSGFSLMGERKVSVGAGDGPDVHVDAIAVMGSVKVTVGDGSVVKTGRAPAAVPAPRAASVAVPRAHDVHRSGGHLPRWLGRAKGLAVPAALLGALVLAGPDNVSIFGDGFERVAPDDRNVQISTLFGSTTVIVPDDRTVDFGGILPFGSRTCVDECATATGEVVHVRTFGGFGSVEVMTESQYAAEQRRERDEERREDLEEQREDRDDD